MTRAAQYVSIDWLAHKLIDRWVAFEQEHGTARQVVQVYSTALSLPMKDSARLHAAFCEYAAGKELADMLSEAEIAVHTKEVRFAKACDGHRVCACDVDSMTERRVSVTICAEKGTDGIDAG